MCCIKVICPRIFNICGVVTFKTSYLCFLDRMWLASICSQIELHKENPLKKKSFTLYHLNYLGLETGKVTILKIVNFLIFWESPVVRELHFIDALRKSKTIWQRKVSPLKVESETENINSQTSISPIIITRA